MNKKFNRESAGKISQDLLQKAPESTDVREIGREMTKGYMEELFTTIADGKTKYTGDFFVVVLTKRERLMTNVIRNFFFHRNTAPTPDYDQAVYHFKKSDDETELLWVIPNRELAYHLRDNALTLDKEYKELLGYVLDFDDKTLFKKAQKLNNEEKLEGRIVLEVIDEK